MKLTKAEVLKYIKTKYPEDRIITVSSDETQISRGNLKYNQFNYIILIKSNLLYLWPAYHSYGKISVYNHRLITFDVNFSVFEKIDEVHNDYDNARKEMYEYKKQELKKGIDLQKLPCKDSTL